jgi:hypothetical protein
MVERVTSTSGRERRRAAIERHERRHRSRRQTNRYAKSVGLALQLPFCFEVRSLSGSLVSSAPE